MFGYNNKKPNRGYRVINFEATLTNIAAIEPCYGEEGGNTTRIYTQTGDVYIVKRRLLTVLKNIAVRYGYNLSTLRKTFGDLLHINQNVPLPLSVNLVLVPVKTRTPKFEQDGATAYINLCAVDQITPHQTEAGTALHSCLVKMKGGRHLPVLYSKRATQKRFEKGEQALNCYRAIHGFPNPAVASLAMENSANGAFDTSTTGGHFKCELLIDYQPDLYSSEPQRPLQQNNKKQLVKA